MRGKRQDKDFIFNFIASSLSEEGISFNDLINKVNVEILSIDNEIKKVEILKVKRSKLLDVKEFLEKKNEI